jgi:uncharacterized protein (DUF58 family)
MAQAPSKFLDMAALASLRHMRFAPKGRIEGSYAGRHRSRTRGGAAEFVDYREYSAGEDLRRLDWKVLARTERPYVRIYQDETDLSCTMVLDASHSMAFSGSNGTISKLAYVQYLSTAISQLIRDQRDRVGLAVLAKGLQDFHSPAGMASHVGRIQESIETLKTTPQSDLATGLRDLFGRLNRRGVLLVMSDFLVDDLNAVFASLRLFRHNHWEVVVLHVVHPEEERLPEGLAYRFEGMENDGDVNCSPADIRRAYEEAFEANAAAVRGNAMAAGCDYRRVSTAVPYMHTLGTFLIEQNG